MNDPWEVITISDDCVVKIYQFWDAQNPRGEWDHAGHLIINTRDYNLSDKDASVPLCRSAYGEDSYRFAQTYVEVMEHGVACPVYFADYGSRGATLSTTDTDSANGIIWMTGEDIAREQMTKEQARKLLHSEVKEFDLYVQGDVHGYVVEYQGEDIDSCWGFYGFQYACDEGREAGEAACERETLRRHEAAQQGIPTL